MAIMTIGELVRLGRTCGTFISTAFTWWICTQALRAIFDKKAGIPPTIELLQVEALQTTKTDHVPLGKEDNWSKIAEKVFSVTRAEMNPMAPISFRASKHELNETKISFANILTDHLIIHQLTKRNRAFSSTSPWDLYSVAPKRGTSKSRQCAARPILFDIVQFHESTETIRPLIWYSIVYMLQYFWECNYH